MNILKALHQYKLSNKLILKGNAINHLKIDCYLNNYLLIKNNIFLI